MDSNLLKDVANYWRKVKSGELPAAGPNEIDNTVWTVEAAIKRIAELEHDNYTRRAATLAMRDSWCEERAELEAKLARFGDVRQHYLAGYDDGHSRGLNAGRLYKEDTGMVMHRHASANAYAVEGGE